MPETTHEHLLQKLHEMELQVARLESHLQSELGNLRRLLDDLHSSVDKTHSNLFGNNDSLGIRGRLDRLEQSESSRKWWVQAMAVVILGLSLTELWRIIVSG